MDIYLPIRHFYSYYVMCSSTIFINHVFSLLGCPLCKLSNMTAITSFELRHSFCSIKKGLYLSLSSAFTVKWWPDEGTERRIW